MICILAFLLECAAWISYFSLSTSRSWLPGSSGVGWRGRLHDEQFGFQSRPCHAFTCLLQQGGPSLPVSGHVKQSLRLGLGRWLSSWEHLLLQEDQSAPIYQAVHNTCNSSSKRPHVLSIGTCTHMAHTHISKNKILRGKKLCFVWYIFLRAGHLGG